MKRFLSILLVCTMLLGLVPLSVFAEETVNTENFTVNYRLADHIKELKMVAQQPKMNILTYNITDGFYKFYSGPSAPVSGQFSYSESCFVVADGRTLSFEISVPEPGTYNLEMFHAINSAGLDVDVYLSRGGAVCDETTYEGYYSTYDANTPYGTYYNSKIVATPSVIENIYIAEAGKYVISFVPNDRKDDGATNWIYGNVGSFNLVKGNGEGKAYMGARLTDTETLLKLNETKKLSPKGYLSDGTEIASELSEFESSNEAVATVSANGEITPVALGETEITFKAAYAGKSETLKLSVRVVSSDGITIKYDFEEVITKLNMVQARPNMTEITTDVTDGFFSFHSGTFDYYYGGRLSYAERCFVMADEKRLSFEIFVPRAGVYNLEMFNAENSAAVKVDVYLSRGEATFEKKIGQYDCNNPDFPIGTYQYSKIEEEPNVIKNVEIPESGNYVISFVANNGVDGDDKNWGDYGNVGSFNLVAGEDSTVMGIELADLNKTQLKVVGLMSDKTRVDNPAGLAVTYESSDPEIASVDENGRVTDHKTGTVTITATAECDGFTYTDSGEYNALVVGKGTSAYYDLVSAMAGAGLTNAAGNGGTAPSLDALTREKTGGYFNFLSATQKNHKSGQMMYVDTSIAIADGYQLAFEVFVPETGVYTMEMYPAVNASGLDVDVFVSRGEKSTAASDKVGTYSTFDAQYPYTGTYFTKISEKPKLIHDIKILEPGYYTFNFVANDGNPGTTTWIYGNVGAFHLVSGKESVLVGLKTDASVISEIYRIETDTSVLEYTDPQNRGTAQISFTAKTPDGTPIAKEITSKRFKTSDKKIATVDENGVVTPVGDGVCNITMTATVDGKIYTAALELTVIDNTGVIGGEIRAEEEIYVREKAKLGLFAEMKSGNIIEVPVSEVTWESSEPAIAEVDADGMITGMSEGDVTVTATATFRGAEMYEEREITVTEHEGKREPTYYTYEKRENALDNVKKYAWAKTMQKSAIAKGDTSVANFEKWYDLIPGPGVPASMQITQNGDTSWNICHYCGVNLAENHGNYSTIYWGVDPLNRPWKIQCPDCKRLFPSNDFGLLYERGVDEHGYFDRDRAVAANAVAVENGEEDALVNVLYPEIAEVGTINCNQGLRPGESVEKWGVDDSFGYLPKDESGNNYTSNKITERHSYIAAYTYILWQKIEAEVTTLRTAYLYTGDYKYGRAGAILLDRIADVYPDYHTMDYNYPDNIFYMGDSNTGYGKIHGIIADCAVAEDFCLSADAFYPMLTDSTVINFLSERAEKFGNTEKNDKLSSSKIQENWEEGILKETFRAAKNYQLNGNFGMHQAAVAIAAIALSREPETTEMVKWIYKTGDDIPNNVGGGNLFKRFVNDVSRDGLGNEAADNYNILWATLIQSAAGYLREYKGEEKYDLYQHPKYASMFTPFLAKTLVDVQSPNIGDSGAVGSIGWNGSVGSFSTAFGNLKETPFAKDLAQYIYMRNGYSVKDLNYGIFAENPESIQDEIKALATDSALTRSEMLSGYGFAVLRDGNNHKSASSATANNNQRDFWIYFGNVGGHGHSDTMNLGIDAFGYSMAPDLGYPPITGKDPERLQWICQGIAHNTVIVDGKARLLSDNAGFPMHFDDAGMVKIVDVDSPQSFEQTENYRRTVVMVNAGDDVSYGIDFFRITGGNEHTFSFHAAAGDATPVYGLDMTEQKDENGNWVGSYASGYDENGNLVEGVNVPYTDKDGSTKYFTGPGQDPWTADAWSYETVFPRGYSWMSKVRRDKTPDDTYSIEFHVKDYRRVSQNSADTHLRVTQLNNFTPDEVSLVGGKVPTRSDNAMFPKTLDYLLVHHRAEEGEKLDSLYTTVYEPYKGSRYISDISPVTVTGEIEADKPVHAVKVTHTSGRVDYVVYATDNTKTYRVDNLFDFRGFVGVYTVNRENAVIYRYVNDGTIIGTDTNTVGAYTGTVVDFDKTFEFGDFENYIDVNLECEDVSAIIGKHVYVETDGVQNGAYKIENAEEIADGVIRLDIGTIPLVRSYVNAYDESEGYIYNIEEGQKFVIPMSFSENLEPVFTSDISNITTSAGSSVSVAIKAESPITNATPTIKYIGATLPRGASLNEDTGVLTWKPDSSQIGDNHVAVTARDSDGRESTIHFTITVYGSTTGGSSSNKTEETDKPETPSTGTGDTPPAGGGGGGGGAAPTDKPDDTANTDEPNTSGESGENEKNEGNTDNTGTENSSLRFTDLANHTWAEVAINTLAADGVIKGTSESTFSPAANITRADFALLLVRAFDLSSENTENFADVSASDYFAAELAIARNTGIVNGIGDNKFAPRNTITRQDMMVIVYRALNNKPSLPKGSEAERNVGAAMNDSPVDYQNRDVTELGEMGTAEWRWEDSNGGGIFPSQYPDFDTVADYARDAVSALISAGLVNGKSGRIEPTDYTTRAEVAVLVKRILDYMKQEVTSK